MKANSQFTLNLSRLLKQASPKQVADGKAWYRAARLEAARISRLTGVPLKNVCGIIAALSPRNKWARNLLDAEAVARGDTGHRCATFKANVLKAYRVKTLPTVGSIERALAGKKTSAFFHNLYDADSQYVTVDVHMLLAAHGRLIPEKERPSLTKKLYAQIEQAIRTVAESNGMKPYECQAALWVAWKEGAANVALP